jgi:hypothetical protein
MITQCGVAVSNHTADKCIGSTVILGPSMGWFMSFLWVLMIAAVAIAFCIGAYLLWKA